MSVALILQGLYHLRINSPVVLLCRFAMVRCHDNNTKNTRNRATVVYKSECSSEFWGAHTSTFRSHRKECDETIFNWSKINYSGIWNDRCHRALTPQCCVSNFAQTSQQASVFWGCPKH